MADSKIAARYAKSLFDLAISESNIDNVVADIRALNDLYSQNKEFKLFLNSPLINKDTKKEGLKKIFASFQPHTLNLFLLMTGKNRESHIGLLGREFMALYNKNQGITEAQVISAVELDEKGLLAIEQYVKANTGAKSVNIVSKIDTSIIGGLVIMFDGRLYDSSVSGQLNKIKKELKIA